MLLAVEVVFISNLVGSGHDWMFTVGLSDQDTMPALRAIQIKTTKQLRPLIGNGFGTTHSIDDR